MFKVLINDKEERKGSYKNNQISGPFEIYGNVEDHEHLWFNYNRILKGNYKNGARFI